MIVTALAEAGDVLIHVCIHQAINHHFGPPWLRAMLDVRVVVGELSPDWVQVVQRARSWRVATVVWTVLDLAQKLLGTPVPDETMALLCPSSWRQGAIRRFKLERALVEMQPGEHWYRRRLRRVVFGSSCSWIVPRMLDGSSGERCSQNQRGCRHATVPNRQAPYGGRASCIPGAC